MRSNEHLAQPKINKFKRKTVWVPRLQTILIQQVWSRTKDSAFWTTTSKDSDSLLDERSPKVSPILMSSESRVS